MEEEKEAGEEYGPTQTDGRTAPVGGAAAGGGEPEAIATPSANTVSLFYQN